jgi:AsmA protein
MRRPLRITLWTLGGLLALVVLGVVVFALTFDANRYKPEIQSFVESRYGRKLAIEGDIGLAFVPKLGLRLGRTTLSGAGGKGEFARLEEARVALALWPLLRGRVEVDRVVLRGLAAELVRHADGRTNFDDLLGEPKTGSRPPAGGKAPPAPGTPVAIDIGGISIADANILWRNERAGSAIRIADLAVDTGRIADDRPGEMRISGKVTTAPTLDARLDARAAYTLSFTRGAYAFKDITLGFEGDIAGWRSITVTGEAEADAGASTARVALRARLDDSNATVNASVSDLRMPKVRFDVDVDRLDLDALRARGRPAAGQTAAKAPAPKPSPSSPAAADAPIDLSGLKALDADGRLRIGALKASGIALQKLDATTRLAGGRLAVDPLTADLYEGSIRGAAVVDANASSFALRQTSSDVQVGALLADATGRDVIAGRGTLQFDVRTQGTTVAALKRGLQGNGRLAVRDGAIKGVNLGAIARRAQALSRGGREAFGPMPAEKTDFAELTLGFTVKDGVARTDDLSASSPLLRLAGAGQADIAAGTVDAMLRPTLIATSTGQDGKTVGEARNVTVPVRVSGPFDRIAFDVDLGAAVRENLRDEAARRLEDAMKERLDERTRGRVGDALKGLFGR